MHPTLLVVLPPAAIDCVAPVIAAGGTPLIDLTAQGTVQIPDGAWVRTHPGVMPPGTGPVVLTGPGDAIPGRPTWLETTEGHAIAEGFAGLVLRGREAGGYGAPVDGLTALAHAKDPSRILLQGGLGPKTAGAAIALGAAGVVIADAVLGCPELRLSPVLIERLDRPDDALTTRVRGLRVANAPTAPVLRRLVLGEDPYALAHDLWTGVDPRQALWLAGTGLRHAHYAHVNQTPLKELVSTYRNALSTWRDRAEQATRTDPVATQASPLGIGVTWEYSEEPLTGGPVTAAIAVGGRVAASESAFERAYTELLGAPDLPVVPAPAIAIIGMGCRFPDAPDLDTFWDNLRNGHSAIRPVDVSRWDPALYWDEDRQVPDKTYARIGAFVSGSPFSPRRYRIPPRVAAQMDPVQHMALDSAWDALQHAGLQTDGRSTTGRAFDRDRCAVILGNSLGGEAKDDTVLRVAYPLIERAIRDGADGADVDSILASVSTALRSGRDIDEDAMPGELSNVIAGRIANALDLGGANFTVDAACASSLAAIQAAVKGLQDGDFDLALTGGADRSMDPATYVKFSKIGALSPDHSAPFDASANGFVMGEGAGVLVLKRYDDAVRDGDTVYAVVRGIGGSSDGRGKGITAPNITGQIRALERAYALSGVDPASVDLIEAHGTSTVVGDKVEVEALSQVIGAARDPKHGPVRLGSVKSMIGHLKSAAGAASLIKAALALHHQTFPPSLGFRGARDDVPLGDVLQVQTQTEPWPEPPHGVRRAGVSAFGFGGTNFHVVLEEATGRPGQHRPAQGPSVLPDVPRRMAAAPPSRLPDGVWAVSGHSREQVVQRLTALTAGAAAPFNNADPVRVSGGYTDEDTRTDQLSRAIKCLKSGSNPALLTSRGVHLVEAPAAGRLAFLFPGQGNQYVGMGLDLAAHYPIVAETLAEADVALRPVLGRTLTELLANTADDATATLTATEHAQPAVFTLDVALLRLLAQHGVTPDLVAGHSLGEYAAAVAAGVLTFAQGLHATSARGREMADIVLKDPGRMIGVQASPERTDELLAKVDGYAISANRNCPTQTVVAGSTDGVAEAEAVFKAHGVETVALPVSHAFHSKVVAPASKPFARVLAALGPKAPTLPFTSNVDGVPYPHDPAAIVDLMSRQLASPVAWTDQIEAMYDDGVRVFVEVGPKRALSGFTRSILGKRAHYAVPTNHPKRGGIASFLDALAALTALGVNVTAPAPVATLARDTPEIAIDDVVRAATEAGAADATQLADAVYPALRDLMAAVVAASSKAAAPAPATAPDLAAVRVVCAGASVGLPGGREVFAQENIADILAGQGRIEPLGDRSEVFMNRKIVRLIKDGAGGASFEPVTSRDDVIQLAGSKAHFDPRDYGVPEALSQALDITSELGIAAAIEALRDAGIPLVRAWRKTTSGRPVPNGWRLPESLQEGTGVIFASAFPGYDRLLEKVASDGIDGEGRFDRRLLFQILAMGHSQLAQFIGAKGPNTQVNAACASTTQAVSIAHDWLRLGRCERVIVVGADDVTGERLLPWIGGGFLAAGAATTAATPEEGALPFDTARHGMILGMGAVGLVLERRDVCESRGVRPVAELLATRISNSAFHGTRLDGEHIAREMTRLVADAATLEGTTPAAMSSNTMFMSHETYTPARGGSASAEATALRAAFGASAKNVTIANTKGFTGHPMGAGIEDAIALKALQYGQIPPIANLTNPDPEFDDLTLSRGVTRNMDYAVRLAAGFGSQVALAMWRAEARGDDRVADVARRTAWLKEVTGYTHVREVVDDRALRVVQDEHDALLPIRPGKNTASAAPIPAPAASAPPAAVVSLPSVPAGRSRQDVLDTLIAVVAAHSGYEPSDLDPEFELEADLGIDTVKQAEVLSELRARFDLGQDEHFRLADHPTLDGLADYLASQLGPLSAAPQAPTAAPVADNTADHGVSNGLSSHDAVITELPAPSRVSAPKRSETAVYAILADVVATQTGYATTDLDPEYELEADLGIDTVKQAEIFSQVRERLGIDNTDDLRLADVPTLGGLAAYLTTRAVSQDTPSVDVAATTITDDEPIDAPPLRQGHVIADLPSFWIRRPVSTHIPASLIQPLHNAGVLVIGTGLVADAVRAELDARGGTASDTPDIVVDVGTCIEDSLQVARTLADKPPRVWITRTAMGGVDTRADRSTAARDGARSGLTKALGREWDRTTARVIDTLAQDADRVAVQLVDEACGQGPDEVAYTHNGRTGVQYALCDAPLATTPADGAVVIVTGGARGIGLAIAQELAKRGCRLALVGRTQPGTDPLDESAEKDRIRAELVARGERVTPVAIEKELAPLRARDEVRQAVASVPGATYHSADLSTVRDVRALVDAVRAHHGAIQAVVHGAGVEDSRPVQDKTNDALDRALGAKVHGAMALMDVLGPDVRVVSMGSVAGRFGNAGQVDYAAANDALARLSTAHPNALCIDWTAWADAGMATRGGMQHLLEQRGVELLPSHIGARLVADWLFSDETGERVVAGALGGFSHRTGHPMLPEVSFDGARVRAVRVLNAQEPWLADHSIDSTPVFPGVIGLEWMATVAAELLGERPTRLRDARFSAPLKVHRSQEPPTVVVEAQLTEAGGAWCTVSSERVLKTGRTQRTLHFQCVADHGSTTAPLPSAFVPDEVVKRSEIYARFFHGPRFQVLCEIVGIAEDGLIADAVLPRDALPGPLRTVPLAIEAGFQAAGMHRWATRHVSGLPHAIESVELLSPPPEDAPLTITVFAATHHYDVDIDGPSGTVARLRGLQLIDRGPVGDDDRLPEPEDGRPRCFAHVASHTPASVARGRARARHAAPSWLSVHETAELTARGTPQRQNDRVMGRIAAKRAIGLLTGAAPDTFTVQRAASGAPVATGVAASVSISHRGGQAVALASVDHVVGIDLERIERRSDAFLADWFSEAERTVCGDSPLRQTLIWSAKEAVLKVLGTGMALPASAVEVTQLGSAQMRVRLSADAQHVADALHIGPLTLSWRHDADDSVIVEAMAATQSQQAA